MGRNGSMEADRGAAPSIASGVRRINAALGAQTVRELHKTNVVLDAGTLALLWGGGVALAVFLGSASLSLAWLIALVAQGLLLQMLGYFAHDAFLHRKLGGPRLWRIGGAICNAPLTLPFTDYVHSHGAHHLYVNTDRDSERYKRDFDRRWVKLVLLTIVGTKLSWSGRFRQGDQARWQPDYSPDEQRYLRRENRGILAWAVLMVGLAVVTPRTILLGYLLPLVVVTPLASSVRVVLEHADVDAHDPLHNSTIYRTGFISRFVFLGSAGDCHLVHHLYPRIPFYNMGKALRLMRPIIVEDGRNEHRSIGRLLYLWFVANQAHGQPWQHERA